MLQDTGHAEGVPIATPRGRSVEVPFVREHAVIFIQMHTSEEPIRFLLQTLM